MEDLQIIELFFQRSEEAVSQTDRKYGRFLRSVAGRILSIPEDSEEVVNLSGGLEQDPAGGAKSAQILLIPHYPESGPESV